MLFQCASNSKSIIRAMSLIRRARSLLCMDQLSEPLDSSPLSSREALPREGKGCCFSQFIVTLTKTDWNGWVRIYVLAPSLNIPALVSWEKIAVDPALTHRLV